VRTPKGKLPEKLLKVTYLQASFLRQNKIVTGTDPSKVKPVGRQIVSIRKLGYEERFHVGEYNRFIYRPGLRTRYKGS